MCVYFSTQKYKQNSAYIFLKIENMWEKTCYECFALYGLLFSGGTKTAAETVVVQSPFLSPRAD